MQKSQLWHLIPVAVFPYVILFSLATLFMGTRVDLFRWIMDSVFHGNMFALFGCVLLFGVLAGALNIVCFIFALQKQWDALSLAKTAMVIKLVQVPAYILIYVLGVALLITIFTIPFSIALFVLDCYTLYLTGTIAVAAWINAGREGLINRKQCIWFIILQFIFCADVFATIFFYKKLLKAKTIDKDSV